MVQVTATTRKEVDACPIRQVLAPVSGKWQMLIVLALEDGGLRFGELKRAIGDVTQRVLTENVRKLERDGYLTRTVDPGPPIAVTYTLTEDVGEGLLLHLKPLVLWALETHPAISDRRRSYDQRQ